MTRTPHPSVSPTIQPGAAPCFRVAHTKTSVCFIWKHRSHMVRPSPNAIHTLVYLSVHKTPLSPSPSRPSDPPTYTKIDALLHHQSSCRPPPPFTLNTHFQPPPATSGFFHKTRFSQKKRLFTSFSNCYFSLHRFTGLKKNRIRTNMSKLYLIRNRQGWVVGGSRGRAGCGVRYRRCESPRRDPRTLPPGLQSIPPG
jgi:hypothetical protein